MVKTANDGSAYAVSSLIDMYSKCGLFGEVCNVFSGCDGNVDLIPRNAMLSAYSREGKMDMALNLFRENPELNDIVSWNTLISGYFQNGYFEKSLALFVQMVQNGVRWDERTLLSVLSACSGLQCLALGKSVHAWVLKNTFFSNQFICNAIVDLYCNAMEEDHNILPGAEHYACMVDMYGRANKLYKAIEFMRKIPVEIDATIWGAFLQASRLSGNIELAKEAAEKLLKVEAHNGARYVQLANVYAAGGNWDDMGKIRNKMRGKKTRKLAGCSWIYVENGVHVFTSGDASHSKSDAVYSALVCLKDIMHFSSAELEQLYEDSGEFF
ncbi:hypothetical protein QN277_005097 [Acacia crassicarpa]|uniref:Pentatricopeptide repeat-containing protein n=1 Tax=Acacia crassicarpa TaxID=499986 RepID=A0AAE1IYT4_9FABA|nr:hypothetical protein QN277_005097 [Acacia crassicarpa]